MGWVGWSLGGGVLTFKVPGVVSPSFSVPWRGDTQFIIPMFVTIPQ